MIIFAMIKRVIMSLETPSRYHYPSEPSSVRLQVYSFLTTGACGGRVGFTSVTAFSETCIRLPGNSGSYMLSIEPPTLPSPQVPSPQPPPPPPTTPSLIPSLITPPPLSTTPSAISPSTPETPNNQDASSSALAASALLLLTAFYLEDLS